jgi:16S rRNA (guanine527-N7)-methyltransferase
LKNKETDILRSWTSNFGIKLSGQQVHLLNTFVSQLWEWNKRMNLTGLTSRERIIRELLLDSLIPSLFLPDEGSVLDLGSGAGFPGIPLKILKDALTFQLLEANSKKASFLRQVIRVTRLSGIVVLKGRIEKDKNLLRSEGYEVITARAVASLRQTLMWCAPHLAPEGMIVNFQGSRFENALRESSAIMQKEHLSLFKSIPYTLPGKNSQRHLLLFVRSAM